MFRALIESIRTEATQRGSLRAAFQRSPGTSKTVKKGVSRFLRQNAKKELKGYTPNKDVLIPRRGIKGYAD
jgi:hypothetical protein